MKMPKLDGIKRVVTTYFWSYVLLSVAYTTFNLVQLVLKYRLTIINVEAMVSPLAK